MRPGQPLYIAPPSASPPPPLSYPVYENRDLVEQPVEELEDNIYEMLPDQVLANSNTLQPIRSICILYILNM